MKDYVGHHTCSNSGGKEYVITHAPFLSEWKEPLPESSYKTPYLGTGYYFWEYDLDQAKRWGKFRYNSSFYIVEGIIHTTNDNFLDLVGDRSHMSYLLFSAVKLVKKGLIEPSWKIGELIETLKKIGENNAKVFPFSIIRSMDYRHLTYKDVRMFRNDESYTYLDPSHIFCLLETNELILSNKRIIFPT